MRERFEQKFNDQYQLLYGLLVSATLLALVNLGYTSQAITVLLFFLTFGEDLAYWLLLAIWNPFKRSLPSLWMPGAFLRPDYMNTTMFPATISSWPGWLGRRFGYEVRIETSTAAFIFIFSTSCYITIRILL